MECSPEPWNETLQRLVYGDATGARIPRVRQLWCAAVRIAAIVWTTDLEIATSGVYRRPDIGVVAVRAMHWE